MTGATRSHSPMDAENGAVMKHIVKQCSSSLWSNLLIHDNLMDRILPPRSSIASR